MASILDRTDLNTLVTNNVLSGGRRTKAGNMRMLFNKLINSCLNRIDDKNVDGGYLSTAVEISFSDLTILQTNNSLCPQCWYKITDRADGGIYLLAVTTNLFAEEGHGIYAVPDFQNVNGNNVGVWNSGLSGLVANTSICILAGYHFQNLTGVNTGTVPFFDAVNWLLLPKTDATYLLELMKIKYSLATDTKTLTVDKRGNEIQNSPEQFQWGNDLVTGNKDSWGGGFDIANQRGYIQGNIVKGGCVVAADETHEGYIFACEFNGDGYFTMNLNSGAALYNWVINSRSDFAINPDTNDFDKTVGNRDSDWNPTFDITGNLSIDLSIDPLAGDVLLTSSNTSETLTSNTGIPYGRRIRFRTSMSSGVTFSQGAGFSMKDSVNAVLLPDQWIEFEKVGSNLLKEYNRSWV